MSPAAQQIPYVRFDSKDVLPDERLDYWQGSLSNVCTLSFPGGLTASEFKARNEMWMLGDMMLSVRECSPHILHRSERSIKLDQLDHYKIHFRIGNGANTDMVLGRRLIHVEAGGTVLTHMAQPELAHVHGGTTINVIIPRDRLDPLLPRPVDLHGVTLNGPCSVLLASHLTTLTQTVGGLTREQLPAVTGATLQLLAAAVTPTLDTLALARPVVEATLMRQVRHFIEANLTNPDLTPDVICKHFKISRSALYRMFEPLGGVAGFIKERRLYNIHTLLTSAQHRPHLHRIAEMHGFKTAAHFSRSFREQFGYSARELFAAAPQRPVHMPISGGPRYSMDRWLHLLRG
ncbi:helix-turn-helix domain-containing protein [Paraburkholderia sp. ZP32-5]|uniref:helix-turn-helix domain-containing protein n=1 Tax=Paraburkholderia sp. ZP32-5 TaxID=2883245 RepID=UPI001F3A8DBC|nr:helix-turn-helix domain-containing protein [Paraburkholderia sp. ZP32-5]